MNIKKIIQTIRSLKKNNIKKDIAVMGKVSETTLGTCGVYFESAWKSNTRIK